MIAQAKRDHARHTTRVLGTPIDAISWDATVAAVIAWAQAGESRYVCICNAHSVVTAWREKGFASALENADMTTPDGAPVAWMVRHLADPKQERINGPDLMLRLCDAAARDDVSIYLLGGAPSTLEVLEQRLTGRFPGLRIVGKASPPFRVPSNEEAELHRQAIRNSGAGLVLVSLGCPKQELWMAEQKGLVPAVMVGVGAAFDFHAGILRRAPLWMQNAGLEWFHRLCSEPRRLWRRYLVTNTLFIVLAARQLLHRPKP